MNHMPQLSDAKGNSNNSNNNNNNNNDAAESKRQKEIKATRKLLSQATDLLTEVDESFIFTNKKRRNYPVFDRSEIKFGPLLGVGGFGIVFEVKDFNLKIPTEVEIHNTASASIPAASSSCSSSAAAAADGHTNHDKGSGLQVGVATTTTIAFKDAVDTMDNHHSAAAVKLPASFVVQDDEHYDVRIARKHMSKLVRRNGDARYAVKRLHRDLTDLERARGMIDMAIEAKYLSVIWHPNIVKMRGMSSGDLLSPNCFFVMDRLYETLVEKMQGWSTVKASSKGRIFGIGRNDMEMEQLLVERLIVAYDLAAAFWYMHDQKLVYRDIKQENIGFDCRGDVKVFDFGLCKSLSPKVRNKDRDGREKYGYNLTARTGSIPYMAPEVVECEPYDTKCDVFSFAILLWELLSLKPAFKGYSRREYLERVARGGERQSINRHWPSSTRTIMKEAWEHDPEKRPDMKRVASMIRGDLNARTTDRKVQQRSQHMRERSEESFRVKRAVFSNTSQTSSVSG